MHLSPVFGEFMGTAMLMLLGNGVCASTALRGSKGEGAGWLIVTIGWGFAVFCAVLTAIACGSPGAHLNPAVTIAVAIRTGIYRDVVPFIAAQTLGACVGSALMWVFYAGQFRMTEDANTKLQVFCTEPAIRNPLANFFSELIATSVLLLVIGAIGSRSLAAAGPAPGLSPYLVGILVWSIGMSLGGTTGYAINPVRDFGPRLMHFLLPIPGKGSSDWSYAPIPIAGPVAAGLLIGIFLRVTGI